MCLLANLANIFRHSAFTFKSATGHLMITESFRIELADNGEGGFGRRSSSHLAKEQTPLHTKKIPSSPRHISVPCIILKSHYIIVSPDKALHPFAILDVLITSLRHHMFRGPTQQQRQLRPHLSIPRSTLRPHFSGRGSKAYY